MNCADIDKLCDKLVKLSIQFRSEDKERHKRDLLTNLRRTYQKMSSDRRFRLTREEQKSLIARCIRMIEQNASLDLLEAAQEVVEERNPLNDTSSLRRLREAVKNRKLRKTLENEKINNS